MRALLAGLALLTALAVAHPASATDYTVVNNGISSWKINGVDNPTLNLVRGSSYNFNVNAIGHPFYIKTAQVIGSGSQYTSGVTNNGTQSGTVSFVVPGDAPATLFYQCGNHADMTGELHIASPAPALAPWSVAALVALLATGGVLVLRRRRSIA